MRACASNSLDDGVTRIDFEILLGRHVAHRRRVAKRLRLHDALHVRRPAVLGRDDAARRRLEAARDGDFLHLLVEDVFDDLAEVLELDLVGLVLFLLVLVIEQIEALACHRDELFAVKLLELLNAVLVDRVDHVDDLVAERFDALNKCLKSAHCRPLLLLRLGA